MTRRTVTVIDYGTGNLYSVQRAFEVYDASQVIITSDPQKIVHAERLVLPGVGAFADGMRGLQSRGLDSAIREFVQTGRPLLGICLGMQLFASKGLEFGETDGLNLIAGRVEAIPKLTPSGQALKTPYIGWAALTPPENTTWQNTLLLPLSPDESIYLVHSYCFKPSQQANVLASYRYGGYQITAAVQQDNITGFQFHPEKSGKVGLRLLKSFLN